MGKSDQIVTVCSSHGELLALQGAGSENHTHV